MHINQLTYGRPRQSRAVSELRTPNTPQNPVLIGIPFRTRVDSILVKGVEFEILVHPPPTVCTLQNQLTRHNRPPQPLASQCAPIISC